jgi:hypothetical protein
MNAFQSERWDINHIINHDKDVSALTMLWNGRANDILDGAMGRQLTLEEQSMIDTYRKCADELKQAMGASHD